MPIKNNRVFEWIAILLVAFFLSAGCGGGTGETAPPVSQAPTTTPPTLLFHFGDAVTEDQKKAFKDVVQNVTEFYKYEHGVEVPYDLTYYVFVDAENFIDFYEGDGTWWLPGVKDQIERVGVYGAYESNAVFVFGLPFIEDSRQLVYLIAHEQFHAFQVPRHDSIFWLIEGSAMHTGAQALEYFGYPLDNHLSAYSRQADVLFARNCNTPLEYMEGYHDFYQVEDLRAGYAVAALAVEYLVDNHGWFEAVIEYYRDPSRDFHAAFGISVEDFYLAFAEYRSAGFHGTGAGNPQAWGEPDPDR